MSGGRFALDTRISAVTLALVVATVSMPLFYGSFMADSHYAITMDICHPTQSIDVSHAPLLASAPQLFSMRDASRDAVLAIDDAYCAMAGRFGEAPDPPPPKTFA